MLEDTQPVRAHELGFLPSHTPAPAHPARLSPFYLHPLTSFPCSCWPCPLVLKLPLPVTSPFIACWADLPRIQGPEQKPPLSGSPPWPAIVSPPCCLSSSPALALSRNRVADSSYSAWKLWDVWFLRALPPREWPAGCLAQADTRCLPNRNTRGWRTGELESHFRPPTDLILLPLSGCATLGGDIISLCPVSSLTKWVAPAFLGVITQAQGGYQTGDPHPGMIPLFLSIPCSSADTGLWETQLPVTYWACDSGQVAHSPPPLFPHL